MKFQALPLAGRVPVQAEEIPGQGFLSHGISVQAGKSTANEIPVEAFCHILFSLGI